MVIATRRIHIDHNPWEHRVASWNHEIRLEHASHRYRIEVLADSLLELTTG